MPNFTGVVLSDPDLSHIKDKLINIASHFYQKGWMVGTSGNLSVRVSPDTFLITASGRPKGQLAEDDLVVVRGLELPPFHSRDDLKPSAEVAIHQAVYSRVGEANAVFHVHSVESNVVSEWAVDDAVLLPPLEMIKGFGVADPASGCRINVLENHLDVGRIAMDLRTLFSDVSRFNQLSLPAFLIRHHGLTVWGRDAMDAFHRIELLEYVFRFMVTERITRPMGPSTRFN